MRSICLVGLVFGLILGLRAESVALAGPKAKRVVVRVYPGGEVFCVSSPLVAVPGSVVIQADRCYRIGVLRTFEGTFLAFLDPDFHLPPGQLVRFRTPAGPKLRGRIFYLVPIQAVVGIPVDSLVLVPIRVEDLGPWLVIVVTDTFLPRIVVWFEVRV